MTLTLNVEDSNSKLSHNTPACDDHTTGTILKLVAKGFKKSGDYGRNIQVLSNRLYAMCDLDLKIGTQPFHMIQRCDRRTHGQSYNLIPIYSTSSTTTSCYPSGLPLPTFHDPTPQVKKLSSLRTVVTLTDGVNSEH